MKSLSDFNIKFEGLKQGTHFFEFDVDNTFFEEFDCFEFDKSIFKIDLEFKKQLDFFHRNFILSLASHI